MKKLILLLLLNLFIFSCAQNLENTTDSKIYVEALQKKEIDEIKNQLRKDTVFLNEIVSFSTTRLRISSLITSGEKRKVTESEPELQGIDSVLINKNFNEYVLSSFFEQQFYVDTINDNKFQLFSNEQFWYRDNVFQKFNESYSESKHVFDYIDDRVEIHNEEYFFLGKKINKNDIGLKGIDSINLNFSLTFPTKVEKVELIPYQLKKINFKNHTIEVDKSELGLEIPLAISKDLVGIQGINHSNVRMSATASSSYPIIEIKNQTKKEIEALSKILNKILVTNDKTKIIELLNQINQKQFEAKNLLNDFKKKADKIDKDIKGDEDFNEITYYESLVNAGRKIISLENQYISFDFPDKVKTIEIYLAKENKTISKNEILYTENKKNNHYNIYYSQGSGKDKRGVYGVVNKNGEIVIKAQYPRLQYIAGNYFYVEDDTYRVDQNKKKLVKVVDYFYQESIKPGYDILRKKDKTEYVGVLKDFDTEILPFKYKSIIVFPSFIKTTLSNGQLEFLHHDFTRINFDSKGIEGIYNIRIDDIDTKYPERYIALYFNEQRRLMNGKLEFLTTKSYKNIIDFNTILNYYIVSIVVDEKTQEMNYGLIDINGKEVTKIMFDSISKEITDSGEINFKEKNKKEQIMKFDEFLKKYKL